MNRYHKIIFWFFIGLAFCIALPVFAVWHVLTLRITEAETALETRQRATARVEADVSVLMSDIARLREALVEQQIIAAEETATVRTMLDERVSELTTTVGDQRAALSTLAGAADIAGLIARWSPYVYDITCDFRDTETKKEFEGSGSATLITRDGKTVFVTNAHVLKEDSAALIRCGLEQPGADTDTLHVDAAEILIDEDADVGYGTLSAGAAAVSESAVCSSDPRIGERIITIGYPTIGGDESVTVTEGIISGFDEGFYITSAKIERGNSGGAAVSVERNCFLGLPTLVVAGRIESLARILPALSL